MLTQSLGRYISCGLGVLILMASASLADAQDGVCTVPLDASQFEDLLLNEVGVIEAADHAVAAPLMEVSPVADGVIGPNEYPNACFYSFADLQNPGNPWPTLDNVDDDNDLSMTMYLAHTDEFLFLGFDVTDDYLDLDDGSVPFRNDGVELFINPDLDLGDAWGPGKFQLDVDAAGEGDLEFNNRFTNGGPIPNATPNPPPVEGEFYSAGLPRVTDNGYVIEYQIPLSSLDKEGGEGVDVVPVETGDVILFNVALDDNDEFEDPNGQSGHHILWQVEGAGSPYQGGEDIWVVPLQLTQAVTTVPGDIDRDGDLDAADIDALAAAIRGGSQESQLDLNSDGTVNNADRVFLVEDLKNTFIGDSNLDGEFNSSDFVVVFQRGQYEDETAGNSGWADGDWNGDADFDSSDFVVAFQSGAFEQGPRQAVASVPEPSSAVLASFLGLALLGLRRRRR